AERDAAKEKLASVATAIERTRALIAERQTALEAANAESEAALAALREHDAALAAQAEQLGRLRIQADAADAEWERLGQATATTAQQVAHAESELERAKAAHEAAQAEPPPMLDESAREALVAELEAARSRELEVRIQVETA